MSMYQASIPVFVRTLGNLKKILKKAEKHAVVKKIDPDVFLGARLAPDMFTLVKQVQIATDMAKGCAARLAGRKVPSYKDNEETFAQLYARIDKTVKFLKQFKAGQIDGNEDKSIEIPTRHVTYKFNGREYLYHFVLPNVFFHITTAYAILRHNGVSLGKKDFLGPSR